MTVFYLKIIAAASMLVDHFAWAVYLPMVQMPWQFELYGLMRGVGRIAFPIYAYLIAQGCLHTRSINRYLLRLGLLALVSEVFFDLALVHPNGGIDFLRNTNIFYTLFFGVAAIRAYEQIREGLNASPVKNIISGVQLAAAPLLAWVFSSDYGVAGVLLILLLYAAGPQNRVKRTAAMGLGLCFFYLPIIDGAPNPLFIFAMAAVLCVFLYNGRPGPRHAAIKWGFYFFYPLHLAALIVLRNILV